VDVGVDGPRRRQDAAVDRFDRDCYADITATSIAERRRSL
jgi:hypothetical protein